MDKLKLVLKKKYLPAMIGVLILVLLFIVFGLLAVLDRRNMPEDVRITNITDSGASVSWYSEKEGVAKVYVKEKGKGSWGVPLVGFTSEEIFYDDRDVDQNNEGEYVLDEGGAEKRKMHHVSIRGLEPEKEYEVKVGGTVLLKSKDADKADLPMIKTGKIIEDLKTPDPVYGKVVYEEQHNLDVNGVVYFSILDGTDEDKVSSTMSTPLFTNTYSLDLSSIRNIALDEYVSVTKGEDIFELEIKFEDKELNTSSKFRTTEYKPLDTILLEREGSQSEAAGGSLLGKTSAIVDDGLIDDTPVQNELPTGSVCDPNNTSERCAGGEYAKCSKCDDSDMHICISNWTDVYGTIALLDGYCPYQEEKEGSEEVPGTVPVGGGCWNDAECDKLDRTTAECITCPNGVDRRCIAYNDDNQRSAQENLVTGPGGFCPEEPTNPFGPYCNNGIKEEGECVPEGSCPDGNECENVVDSRMNEEGSDVNVDFTGEGQDTQVSYTDTGVPVSQESSSVGVENVPVAANTCFYSETSGVYTFFDVNPGVSKHCIDKLDDGVQEIHDCFIVDSITPTDGGGVCNVTKTEISLPGTPCMAYNNLALIHPSFTTLTYTPGEQVCGYDDAQGRYVFFSVSKQEVPNQQCVFTPTETLCQFTDPFNSSERDAPYDSCYDPSTEKYISLSAFNNSTKKVCMLVNGSFEEVSSIIDMNGTCNIYITGGSCDPTASDSTLIDMIADDPHNYDTSREWETQVAYNTCVLDGQCIDLDLVASHVQPVCIPKSDGEGDLPLSITRSGDGFCRLTFSQPYPGVCDVKSNTWTRLEDVLVDPTRCPDNLLNYQSSSFVSSVRAESILGQSNNEGVDLAESGAYSAYYGESFDQPIAEFAVNLDGRKAKKVRLFIDTNGNGIKDPDEKIIRDYKQIKLKKDSDAATYELQVGWNLIALPLSPSEDIDTASQLVQHFNSKGASIKHVAKYTDTGFVMFTEREDGSEFSNDFHLIPGQGYFVLNYTYAKADIKGNKFDESVPFSVRNGWNLVGVYTNEQSYTAEELLKDMNADGIVADTVSDYSSGLYKNLIYEDDVTYGNDINLIERKGYFIRVKSGGGSENQFTPKPGE